VKKKAEHKVANAYYGDPVAQGGGADWGSSSLGPASRPYSPYCLEEDFCELRLYGVLGSLLNNT
jgi:hypothetical protein